MSRKCIAVCFCCLVLGVLLGILVDWTPRRHQRSEVSLTVEPSEKVYLAPRPGDVVRWAPDDDRYKELRIKWQNGSPCKATDPALQCTIDAKAQGFYFYKCVADDGSTDVCPDPGWHTQPSGVRGPFLLQFLEAVWVDLEELFGINALQPRREEFAGKEGRASPVLHEEAVTSKTAAAPPPALNTFDCNGSATELLPISPAGNSNDPTVVVAGQPIIWQDSVAFTLDFGKSSNPNVCGSPVVSSQNDSAQCTISTPGPYTYLASRSTCSQATQESIEVKLSEVKKP